MRARITPLEIRKQEFSRKFKGYNPEEVRNFLASVADDVEDLLREFSVMETRTIRTEEENGEHREREKILKETLLTAQQAAEDIRSAARREAEVERKEAGLAAQRTIDQALARASEIERNIRELKIQRANFRLQLEKMLELFQQVLEFDKQEDETQADVSYLTRKKDESAGS
jgi:cell division initiation protein